MRLKLPICLLMFAAALALPTRLRAQQPAAPTPQSGSINGTVTDSEDDVIPGATIVLDGQSPADHQTAQSGPTGFFEINELQPGTYHITVTMKGFADWTSSDLVLKPGQDLDIPDIKMTIAAVDTSVTALYTRTEIATQQAHLEEEQRVFGIVPNFYVVYEHDAVALTPKLKFQLAFRSIFDPVTFLGVNFYAGIQMASGTPSYVAGAKGYGQRVGADYADGFSDILFGGAILPTLLHQDPRFFYKGSGGVPVRILYALAAPFLCKGDNGHWQPNISSVGGDLISGALSNSYYPQQDRGLTMVFTGAAISSGGRMVNALAQEFLFRRHTSKSSANANL